MHVSVLFCSSQKLDALRMVLKMLIIPLSIILILRNNFFKVSYQNIYFSQIKITFDLFSLVTAIRPIQSMYSTVLMPLYLLSFLSDSFIKCVNDSMTSPLIFLELKFLNLKWVNSSFMLTWRVIQFVKFVLTYYLSQYQIN